MSLWSRIANVFHTDRLSREIDEELQSHLAEAVEQGRDPVEARKALGPALRLREESRDAKLITWLDSLRADAVFGWRQIMKNKVTMCWKAWAKSMATTPKPKHWVYRRRSGYAATN